MPRPRPGTTLNTESAQMKRSPKLNTQMSAYTHLLRVTSSGSRSR